MKCKVTYVCQRVASSGLFVDGEFVVHRGAHQGMVGRLAFVYTTQHKVGIGFALGTDQELARHVLATVGEKQPYRRVFFDRAVEEIITAAPLLIANYVRGIWSLPTAYSTTRSKDS